MNRVITCLLALLPLCALMSCNKDRAKFDGIDPEEIVTLAISPDHRLVARANAGPKLFVVDATTGKQIRMMAKQDTRDFRIFLPCRAVFAPDSKSLAVVEGHVRIIDLGSGKELVRFTPNPYGPDGAEVEMWGPIYSPDGKMLAFANREGRISFWEAATGKMRLSFLAHSDHLGNIYLVLSPNGKILLSESHNGYVELWDVATGKLIETLYHDTGVHHSVFSPKGDILATSSATDIKLWDVHTLEEKETLATSARPIAFSADSAILAVVQRIRDNLEIRLIKIKEKVEKTVPIGKIYPDSIDLPDDIEAKDARMIIYDKEGKAKSFALGDHPWRAVAQHPK